MVCKLDILVGSLKIYEFKEVVNKVFNIVFDLFSFDECLNWDMDFGKIVRKTFLFLNI